MNHNNLKLITILKAVMLAAVCGVIVGLAGCGSPSTPTTSNADNKARSTEKIVIAVQPTNTAEQLASEAKQMEEFLESRMQCDVELIFPTSYAGVVEALRFGHAHAAFMNAWALSLAERRAGAEVVLAEVREVIIERERQEQPYYFSYWVVRPDSPYQTLADLRGKTVSLPSQLSTSGYVAPLARMVELGLLSTEPGKEVDPKTFFSNVLLAGGYAQSYEALKQKQAEATVIAGDVSEKLYREVLDNTRIIERQGPVPSHGIAFAKNLADPQRTRLREALLELGQPERRELMRKFVSAIFISFKPTTGAEHLASLQRFLDQTQLQYVERMR